MQNVRVKDLLPLESIRDKLTLITTNKLGLDNPVTFVTIMESPDFYQWVSGGEFVLTSWYAFSKNPDIQLEAFEKLAKKISAIAIKVGRFIDNIPPSIIVIAEKHNLPIFEIEKNTKFREVIQTIAAEIQNYQTNLLKEVDNYYQELIQISLNTDSFKQILFAFRKRNKCSCFCLGTKYNILGYSLKTGHTNADLSKWIIKFKEVYFEKINLSIAYNNIDKLHVFICQGKRNLLGFFIVVEEDTLSEKVKLMCQQTSSFLSLKLLENDETNQKKIVAFWDKFIKNRNHTNLEEVKLELEKFGLPLKHGYTLILMENILESGKIINLIEISVKGAVSFVYSDSIVMIILGRKHDMEECLWLTNLKKYLEKKQKKVLVVISPDIKSLDYLLESYFLTKNTYELLKKSNLKTVVNSKDYIMFNMIFQKYDTFEYKFLQREIVEPLKKYDIKYKTDLFNTLKESLLENTLEKSAVKLHVHINTLRYRLGKVEEITGKNFFKIRDRYILMIACCLDKNKENIFIIDNYLT